MRRFAPHATIPADAHGASIALGNFDGVHLGHQAVIAAARNWGGRFAAAVFEPHPRQVFQPLLRPFRLQTPDQRARCLAALGVSELFEIAFDNEIARMGHRDFARLVLHERLGAKHVTVGQDFRFGRGRTGDVVELTLLGEELGFGVSAIAPVRDDAGRISSSAIRAAIRSGDLPTAAAMLSRHWAIQGEVQRGFARGRELGFATANVPLGQYQMPRLGVYAVRVNIGGQQHQGVASIGVNPTTGALEEPLLEAHIFDFDRDLYGQTIEVELIAFLRVEEKFADLDALKAQMARDADAAREALK